MSIAFDPIGGIGEALRRVFESQLYRDTEKNILDPLSGPIPLLGAASIPKNLVKLKQFRNAQASYRRNQKLIDQLEDLIASKYGEKMLSVDAPLTPNDAMFNKLDTLYDRRNTYWDIEGILRKVLGIKERAKK